MTKLKPGINRVMVLPDEYKQTFGDSLLIVPDNKKKIPNYGTVIEVGEMKEPYSLYPEQLKKGDRVLWSPDWYKQQGHEIVIEGKSHFIFHAELILGRFDVPNSPASN